MSEQPAAKHSCPSVPITPPDLERSCISRIKILLTSLFIKTSFKFKNSKIKSAISCIQRCFWISSLYSTYFTLTLKTKKPFRLHAFITVNLSCLYQVRGLRKEATNVCIIYQLSHMGLLQPYGKIRMSAKFQDCDPVMRENK